MGLLRLGGSNPPLSARFDKPPYGGFFVTGIHERRRRAPVIGIHGTVFSHVAACRSAAPALYPTPGIGPQPCTPASCIFPYFPSQAPVTSCSASLPRFPVREVSRLSPPAQ